VSGTELDYGELRTVATKILGGPPLKIAQADQVEAVLAAIGRMVKTWSLRDPAAWAEELVQLDMSRANTALVRLRREVDGTLTIARFFDAYRALDTTRPTDTAPVECSRCGGSGWIDAPGRTFPDGRVSTAVTACERCDAGTAARRTQLRIIDGGRR
jgi:hypothetical protein